MLLLVFLFGLALWVILKYKPYRLRLLDAYVGLYLSAVLIWPWPCMRFLVPVFPFLLLMLYRLVSWMAERTPKPRAVAQILPIVIVSSVLVHGSINLAAIECTRLYGQPFLPSSDVEISEWKAYERLFQWIRETVPSDAILSGGQDPLYYLYTSRRAIGGLYVNPYEAYYAPELPSIKAIAEEMEGNLKDYKVDYLIVVPGLEPSLEKIVSRLNAKHPGFLQRVFENEQKSIFVYEIKGSRGAAPGAAADRTEKVSG